MYFSWRPSEIASIVGEVACVNQLLTLVTTPFLTERHVRERVDLGVGRFPGTIEEDLEAVLWEFLTALCYLY